MNVRNLEKTLRSTTRGEVPADLRERLIGSIPEDFGPVRAESHPFKLTGRKLIYLAVAAVLAIAVVHFSGIAPLKRSGPDRLSATSFGFASVAVADVVKNLEDFGAFYAELDLRTGKRESFEYIAPGNAFSRVRIWLERPSERFQKGRMRVEKDERRTVFNGEKTLFYDTENGEAKFFEGGRIDAQIADPARWVRDSVPLPDAMVSLDTLKNDFGMSMTRLTVREKGVPMEPGSTPAFFREFDRRTVITWETVTKHLTDLERYVTRDGNEILVAKLRSIEYQSRIDDEVFSQDLPEGVHLMEVASPDDKQYSGLEPEEVAREMFTAWMHEDWDKVKLFCGSRLVLTYMKLMPLASFKITGQKFKRSPGYTNWMVPYELIFKDGGVKRLALSLRWDKAAKRYVWNGGL